MIHALFFIYIILVAFSTLAVVALVGKPREPITGSTAVVSVATNAGLIALLVYALDRLY